MAKKAKESFIVFYEWEENLAKLSDEQMGQVFRAMFAYEKRGERYEGTDFAVDMAMNFIYGVIDRNREKYAEISRQRSIAGAKGGAPKGNRNAAKQAKQAIALENKQNQPKQAEHEHDHERDHEPEHDYDHERENEREYDYDRERERENEREGEREGSAAGAVSFFREHFSGFSDSVGREIEEHCRRMGEATVKSAMETAVQSGKMSWGYCKGILKNWSESGGGMQTGENGLLAGLPDPLPANWPRVPVNPHAMAPGPSRPATLAEKAEMDRRTAENQRQLQRLLDEMEAGSGEERWNG